MADVEPVFDDAAVYGLSLTTADIEDVAAGTINGSWVTPCRNVVWTGILYRYEENNGTTMVDADIQIQVQFAGDSNVYTVTNQDDSVWEITGLTGVDIARQRSLVGDALGDPRLDLRGITHIRAVTNTTGTTMVTGDVVDVSFIGYTASWNRKASRMRGVIS